jgi:hypothetical protein
MVSGVDRFRSFILLFDRSFRRGWSGGLLRRFFGGSYARFCVLNLLIFLASAESEEGGASPASFGGATSAGASVEPDSGGLPSCAIDLRLIHLELLRSGLRPRARDN